MGDMSTAATYDQALPIAQEIWDDRYEAGHLRTPQDAKWYVAEAELSERLADEVYDLLVSWLG